MSNEIVNRAKAVAALQSIYAEKLAKVNAAIPAIDATQGERDAYQLLYHAGEDARREVQSAALKLAADAPSLVAAL